MSVKVTSAVWESDVTDGRLVLLALADNANDAGRCWPGIEYLAGKCQVHRSTVMRQLEKLVDSGLVVVEERRRSNGSRRSNLYRINLTALRARHRRPTPEEVAELEGYEPDETTAEAS
jgi:DNA-binding transcriptional ArsR family regulator